MTNRFTKLLAEIRERFNVDAATAKKILNRSRKEKITVAAAGEYFNLVSKP